MSGISSPLSSGRCLLLVEDDSMVRETIILMLEDDYTVLCADSAAAALGVLDAATRDGTTVDLVLLDCLLPAGNVGGVLAAADRHSIPVVLISGDPTQVQMAGVGRPFLTKPFSQTALLATMKRILSD